MAHVALLGDVVLERALQGDADGYTSIGEKYRLDVLTHNFGAAATQALFGSADGYDNYQHSGPAGSSRGAVAYEFTAVGSAGTLGVARARHWGAVEGDYSIYTVLWGAYP